MALWTTLTPSALLQYLRPATQLPNQHNVRSSNLLSVFYTFRGDIKGRNTLLILIMSALPFNCFCTNSILDTSSAKLPQLQTTVHCSYCHPGDRITHATFPVRKFVEMDPTHPILANLPDHNPRLFIVFGRSLSAQVRVPLTRAYKEDWER